MLIKLNHLDRLALDYEGEPSTAPDPEEEIRRFLRDRVLEPRAVHRASLFLTDRAKSECVIFEKMPLPESIHGDYSGWAKLAGHVFDAAVTIGSFDLIVRRLVEVASASGHGRHRMRVSSHDLKSLFSNWMDTTT